MITEDELKYSLNEIKNINIKDILNLFMEKGFNIIKEEIKTNSDNYYDDKDLTFYKKGISLRIRTVIKNGSIEKYKVTYKEPKNSKEYLKRIEDEKTVDNDSFETLMDNIEYVDYTNIISTPIINSYTLRKNTILKRNDFSFSFCEDDTKFTNYLNQKTIESKMLELEHKSGDNKEILDVKKILEEGFPNLKITKVNKYQMGIEYTTIKN